MMLYLIGVDHSVQHDGRVTGAYEDPDWRDPAEFKRLRDEFPAFLCRVAREKGASVIAEELSEDALRKADATKSIARTVASQLGIKHVFCEPSISERKHLGIESTGRREDYPKRERIWLKKLMPIKKERLIFVLGACHIHSFSERAKNAGFLVNVVEAYYGREYFAPERSSPIDRLLS